MEAIDLAKAPHENLLKPLNLRQRKSSVDPRPRLMHKLPPKPAPIRPKLLASDLESILDEELLTRF